MPYMVEPIGARFTNKSVAQLSGRFNGRESEGWKLHSVFAAEHQTCVFLGTQITYYAIYEWTGATQAPYTYYDQGQNLGVYDPNQSPPSG